MNAEIIIAISTTAQAFIAICLLFVAISSYKISQRSIEQTEQDVYLKLYELVERHHGREITKLRGCIYTPENECKLEIAAQAAKAKGTKSLKEYDKDFHLEVSALINYFESVGMFLQFRWKKMPEESKDMMLAMLHNSTTKTWEKIEKHTDFIYGYKRPLDWAKSFQWLFRTVADYRRVNNLD